MEIFLNQWIINDYCDKANEMLAKIIINATMHRSKQEKKTHTIMLKILRNYRLHGLLCIELIMEIISVKTRLGHHLIIQYFCKRNLHNK